MLGAYTMSQPALTSNGSPTESRSQAARAAISEARGHLEKDAGSAQDLEGPGATVASCSHRDGTGLHQDDRDVVLQAGQCTCYKDKEGGSGSHLDASEEEDPHCRRFIGVRRRRNDRWVAEIKDGQHGIRKWLGTYDCPVLAAKAFDACARAIRGDSTRTNFTLDGMDCHLEPRKLRPRKAPGNVMMKATQLAPQPAGNSKSDLQQLTMARTPQHDEDKGSGSPRQSAEGLGACSPQACVDCTDLLPLAEVQVSRDSAACLSVSATGSGSGVRKRQQGGLFGGVDRPVTPSPLRTAKRTKLEAGMMTATVAGRSFADATSAGGAEPEVGATQASSDCGRSSGSGSGSGRHLLSPTNSPATGAQTGTGTGSHGGWDLNLAGGVRTASEAVAAARGLPLPGFINPTCSHHDGGGGHRSHLPATVSVSPCTPPQAQADAAAVTVQAASEPRRSQALLHPLLAVPGTALTALTKGPAAVPAYLLSSPQSLYMLPQSTAVQRHDSHSDQHQHQHQRDCRDHQDSTSDHWSRYDAIAAHSDLPVTVGSQQGVPIGTVTVSSSCNPVTTQAASGGDCYRHRHLHENDVGQLKGESAASGPDACPSIVTGMPASVPFYSQLPFGAQAFTQAAATMAAAAAATAATTSSHQSTPLSPSPASASALALSFLLPAAAVVSQGHGKVHNYSTAPPAAHLSTLVPPPIPVSHALAASFISHHPPPPPPAAAAVPAITTATAPARLALPMHLPGHQSGITIADASQLPAWLSSLLTQPMAGCAAAAAVAQPVPFPRSAATAAATGCSQGGGHDSPATQRGSGESDASAVSAARSDCSTRLPVLPVSQLAPIQHVSSSLGAGSSSSLNYQWAVVLAPDGTAMMVNVPMGMSVPAPMPVMLSQATAGCTAPLQLQGPGSASMQEAVGTSADAALTGAATVNVTVTGDVRGGVAAICSSDLDSPPSTVTDVTPSDTQGIMTATRKEEEWGRDHSHWRRQHQEGQPSVVVPDAGLSSSVLCASLWQSCKDVVI